MQKKIRLGILILVVSLVLTMPCLAADGTNGQAGDSQTKQPAAAATPAPEGKVVEGQPQKPVESPAKAYNGKIIDAQTKAPIEGALITLGDVVVSTDKDGVFHLDGTGETLKLRAPGYARKELAIAAVANPQAEIALTPFKVKALYLTVYGAASKKIRWARLSETGKSPGL